MTTFDKLAKFQFHDKQIPQYMYSGIINYVDHGIMPGSFLEGILLKDLETCVSSADSTNLWLIPVYFAFFYNEIPGNIWGSNAKIEKHIRSMYETNEQ